LAKEAEKDVQAREMMIISFTGLVQDFMRKFRKVTATVRVFPFFLSILLTLPLLAAVHWCWEDELISRKKLWSLVRS
jgi:hypothetical protein